MEGGSHKIATDVDGEEDVHPDKGERTNMKEGVSVSVITWEVGLWRQSWRRVQGSVLEGREAFLTLK